MFLALMCRGIGDAPREQQRLFDVAAVFLMVTIWSMALTGFVLTSIRPV